MNSFINSAFPQTFWEQTNGPIGGGVGQIKMYNHLIVGISSKKVVFSSDVGSSWLSGSPIPLDSGLISSIFLLGTDTILVGTSRGIFRSTDFGNNWEKEPPFFYNSLSIIRYDSLNKKVYLVDAFHLYVSNDYGKTWNNINGNLPHNQVMGLEILNNGMLVVVTFHDGVFRSNDGGINWFSSNSGLPAFQYWTKLAKAPSGKLFASIDENKLFSSVDEGISWSLVNDSLFFPKSIFALNDSTVYLGEGHEKLKLSNDGGISWRIIHDNPNNSNDYVTDIVRVSDDTLLINLGFGGLFLSTNGGDNWIQKGFNTAKVLELVSNKKGYLFAKTYRAIYRSINSGESWDILGSPDSPISGNHICLSDSNKIFIVTDSYKIKYSLDNGINWNYTNPDYPNYDCSGLAITDRGTLITMSDQGKSFRSTDDGQSWQLLNQWVGGFDCVSKNGITYLAHTNGVTISYNDGVDWVDHFLFPYPMWLISFDANSRGEIYFGTSAGLYKSVDSAKTFFPLNTNFAKPINCIKVVGDNILYCLTEDGFFKSINDGQKWQKLSEENEPWNIEKFILNSDGHFYAATSNYSVIKSTQLITSIPNYNSTEIGSYNLLQNYPNPFNPSTKIDYFLPEYQKVTIEIFDLLGNKIKILTDDFQEAGNHSVSFSAKNIASGLYFYRITAGNFIQVKKMVLLK